MSDLNEAEQWERAKALVGELWIYVVGGVAIGGAILWGWGWNKDRIEKRSVEASTRYEEAIEASRRACVLRGDADGELQRVLSSAVGQEGYRQIQRTIVRQIELPTLERRASSAYASPLDFARAYAQIGEQARALSFLDTALTERSPGLVFLNVDSVWDEIRTTSEFRRIVKGVGMPH